MPGRPHAEILGYLSSLTARPGDDVDVMVSCTTERFEADFLRLRHGDVNPAGPGPRTTTVSVGLQASYPGGVQAGRPGSFGLAAVRVPGGSVSLQGWVMPTRPGNGERQGILALDAGVTLEVDEAGAIALELADGSRITGGGRVAAWQWLFVAATLDAEAGVAVLHVRETAAPWRELSARGALQAPVGETRRVLLAAADVIDDGGRRARVRGFDGRLEAPAIFARALSAAEVDALARQEPDHPRPLVRWRFELEPEGRRAIDDGAQAAHADLVHLPQRLVLGHRDRADDAGDVGNDRLTAAHFHADDLEDAGWRPSLSVRLPGDLRSGAYGVRLTTGDGSDSDTVPLIVLPPRGVATADVAVLFPTFSYLAYANERLQDAPRDMEPGDERGLPIAPDRGDLLLRNRRDLGLSVYDVHADGSGCCYSSARRPILNFRPDHRNWQTHAPRAFAADLYLVDWLDELGVGFDALDDAALHAEGIELLSRYRVLVTGSHPEYWTGAMLDAVEAFLDAGGRLMYLGGNGFYWVTSVDPGDPQVIEVRRGHNGTRPWEPRPGETRHSTSGEVGGLWRYRGRGPNRLAGIGFSAQGYSEKAAPFHRLPASSDPRAAWLFEGVGDGPIGDAGLIMNGASGDEIDRADVTLGTPPHALVVATSAGGHTDNVSVVVEDLLIAHPGVGGARHPLVRADVAFFETGRGGAVFSAGSMGWTGCLSHDGYRNPLARLTANALRRFRDPAPFPVPAPAGGT